MADIIARTGNLITQTDPNNVSTSFGWVQEPGGTWMGLTQVESKTGFKTEAGAKQWFLRRATDSQRKALATAPGITLQTNTVYWMGASSSPTMIYVTSVDDKAIEYIDPNGSPRTTERIQRIQRGIGEDLIIKGSRRWLEVYGEYQPRHAESIRSMLAGGHGMTEPLRDYDRIEISVRAKDPASGDLWRHAESYGNVVGFSPAVGPYIYKISGFRRDVEPALRDPLFEPAVGLPTVVTSASPTEPPNMLAWMIERHGESDLKMDREAHGGYVPTVGVLGNREEGRERDQIVAIGTELYGNQFAHEHDRDGVWVTYRDNRDKAYWQHAMKALVRAFEDAGFKMQGRALSSTDRPVVLYRQDLRKLAESVHGPYMQWLAEHGSQAARAALPIPIFAELAEELLRSRGLYPKGRSSIERVQPLTSEETLEAARRVGFSRAAVIEALEAAQEVDRGNQRWSAALGNAHEMGIVHQLGSRYEVTPLGRRALAAPDVKAAAFKVQTTALQADPRAVRAAVVRRLAVEKLALARAAVEEAKAAYAGQEAVVEASTGKSRATAQAKREKLALALVKQQQKLLRLLEENGHKP